MNTGCYFFKLMGPRPDFAMTMTSQERELMEQHAAYCAQLHEKGWILNYGPVFAPSGSFGFAVLKMADADEVEAFAKADPSIAAGMNRYEFYPMVLVEAKAGR